MRKEYKKIFALLLASTLLFTGCGSNDKNTKSNNSDTSISSDGTETTNGIKKIGSFDGTEIEVNYYDFDGFSKEDNSDQRKFIDYMGNEKEDYHHIEAVNSQCYKVVKKIDADSVNYLGLIDISGEELIPCETAILENLSDRFVEVGYITGETNDKKKCLIYSTDRMITLGGMQDGDKMYTGYIQIFDLQTKQFVPNIKIDHVGVTVEVSENAIYLRDDVETKEAVYSDKGEQLLETDGYDIVFGDGVYLHHVSDGSIIYSEDGEKLYSTKDNLSLLEGNSQCFSVWSEDGLTVIDKNGKQVSEQKFDQIYSVYDGIINGSINKKYGLMDFDGNKIIPFEYDTSFTYNSGYWMINTDEGTTLAGKDGLIAEGLDNISSEYLAYQKVSDSGCQIQILKTNEGTLDLPDDNPQALCTGYIAAKNEEVGGKYGVYNLFTGDQVIDSNYDEVVYVNGYIYARNDATWDIFEIE